MPSGKGSDPPMATKGTTTMSTTYNPDTMHPFVGELVRTNRRRRNGAELLARQAEASWAAAESYRKMLALATDLGLEFEMERMAQNEAEMQEDGDLHAEAATLLGYVAMASRHAARAQRHRGSAPDEG